MSDLDLLIRGARVVDGTGNPWFYGDVALAGERIAAITPPGQIAPEQVAQVIDATGMVVCPGFIDIQSHSILTLMRILTVFPKLRKG
ncbi:MAG: hypothetical protein R2867_09665 [Caldilineaceae bacterium]